MTPTLLMVVVLAGLMAWKLVDSYLGGHYMCPPCGARRGRRHAHDCSWNRPS